MNKKIVIFSLLTILTISSCNSGKKPDEKPKITDSDFDGLLSDVDPDDNNNVYTYTTISNGDSPIESEPDTFTMDYRFFVDKNFNYIDYDLAKLGILLCSSSAGDVLVDSIKIHNNVYTNEESKINSLLVQLGCSNVKYFFHDVDDSTVDKKDVGGLVCGEHSFEYKNKKYQVFLTSIFPYSKNAEGWYSNFDVGADSKEYTDIYGVSPNWTDKSLHKGFSVSSQRVYSLMTSYFNDYKKEGYEQIVFNCGHSRGGAIANLIGKYLQDDGIKSTTYSYAPPATIATEDQDYLASYSCIHNIINQSDIVPAVPLFQWGCFDVFGKRYSFSLENKAQEYENRFKTSYTFLSDDTKERLITTVLGICPTREALYELSEETIYGYYSDEAKALEAKDELLSTFDDNPEAKKFVNVEIRNVDDYYFVCHSTRPALVGDMVSKIVQTGFDLSLIMQIITSYEPFLDILGNAVLSEFSMLELMDIASSVMSNHVPKAYMLGIDQLMPKIN